MATHSNPATLADPAMLFHTGNDAAIVAFRGAPPTGAVAASWTPDALASSRVATKTHPFDTFEYALELEFGESRTYDILGCNGNRVFAAQYTAHMLTAWRALEIMWFLMGGNLGQTSGVYYPHLSIDLRYRAQVELCLNRFVAGAIVYDEGLQIAAAAGRCRAISVLLTANAKQNVRSRMADVMNNSNLTSEEALPASRHAHATLSLPLVARAGQKRHQGAQGVRQPPQGRGRADQRQTPRHRHGGTTPSTRRATGFF